MKYQYILALALIFVIAVSGCVEGMPDVLKQMMGQKVGEVKEAQVDILTIEKSTTIPEPPIVASSEFTVSFEITNIDKEERAENVKVSLYDYGMCTPDQTAFTPSEGWTDYEYDFGTLVPLETKFVEFQFTAPSNRQIGYMEAECPIKYKVKYTSTTRSQEDVQVISSAKLKALQQAGQSPTFTPTLNVGKGPIKIYFKIETSLPAKENSVIPLLIWVENKGSGTYNRIDVEKLKLKIPYDFDIVHCDKFPRWDIDETGNYKVSSNGELIELRRGETSKISCTLQATPTGVIEETKTYYITAEMEYDYELYKSLDVKIKPGIKEEEIAPVINVENPKDKAMIQDTKPKISATYSDPSGIDTDSIILKLDGNEVSPTKTISAISYTPTSDLEEKEHTVYLEVSDIKGNKAKKIWSFTIDATAPQPSNGQPTGVISDTTPELSVDTNEAATCRGSTQDEGYENMDFQFIGTGTTHKYQYKTIFSDGTYTIYVRCKDEADNIGSTSYSWSFTIDSTAPTVTLSTPSGGEYWAGGSTHDIKWSSVSDANLADTPITLEYITDGEKSTIETALASTPSTYLWLVPSINSQTVKVKITAVDKAGNSASDESNNYFTIDSTAPTVTSTSPVDVATGVAITVKPTAIFSELMDANTITASTFTLKYDTTSVGGSVAYVEATKTATFTPSASLSSNTKYTATVTTEVKDKAGNSLAADKIWTFTTAP